MHILIAAVLVAAGGVHPASAQDVCPASRPFAVQLSHTRLAMAHGEDLLIVALGSSSTQSWMATDRAHSYPAVLQVALERALPRAHVAVVNRGIGGQDAADELARLDADVLAVRPQLVIWQVGANGALGQADPEQFAARVAAGVARIHAAGADIILMDNQRAPRILATPNHAAIDQALADAAAQTGASVFSRGALMAAWASEGAPPSRFLSPDGLHHNDLGYHCLAEALAATITAGLTPAMAER